MLQQTQVNTAIPYFHRFISSFPSLEVLAESDIDEVLKLWSGLGYYARARNLLAAAKLCKDNYGGQLPDQLDLLQSLPGIGRSTAGAIMSLSFGIRAPILDGNVKRVLSRYHAVAGDPGSAATLRKLWNLSELETPRSNVAAYTQAIMDLGSLVCRPRNPMCQICPLRQRCCAFNRNQTATYPDRRRAKGRQTREVWFFWATRGSQILLEKRQNSTVWRGLFCLPEFPKDGLPEHHCEKWFGLTSSALCRANSFSHDFSHYHLNGRLLACKNSKLITIPKGPRVLKWLNISTMEDIRNTALPAPIRALIRERHLGLHDDAL